MVNATPSYSDYDLINPKTDTEWGQMFLGFIVLISPILIARL